jgi:hypothetical protein
MSTPPVGMCVLDARRFDLPATATYGRRSICWIPADRTHPNYDGRFGNLIIKLQHAKDGVRRKIEVDTYAVEPDGSDNGGRAFWLMNLSDPHTEEPYRCVIGGMTPHCKCTAGKCRVPAVQDSTVGCKHRDSLLCLLGDNPEETNFLDLETPCLSTS